MSQQQQQWEHVILITGAAGFIGSHVCDEFVQHLPQCLVVGFDSLEYCASMLNLARAMQHRNFAFVHGNILDGARLKETFERYKVDSVVHLAAQSHVDASFGNSLSFTETNVRGTHTLLEVARTATVPMHRFVHVSTDEVYGSNALDDDAHDEKALLNPTNPYSASKAAAEMFVRSFYYSYRLPVLVTRSNNIFGPRQYPEKVIPRFAMRLLRGKQPQIHGAGAQTRSFLYATDVARAMRLIFEKGVVGETYNIGTTEEHSILSLAQQMSSCMAGSQDKIQFAGQDRPFNDLRYPLDWSKMTALGWRPEVSFESGIAQTIEWYKTIDAESYWPNQQWLDDC